MKKKILKIAIITVSVVIVGVIIWLLVAFFGNPVSKHLAEKSAQEYLEANFSDTDYVIDEAFYDFKGSHYYVRVNSPSSADSYFNIIAGLDGKVAFDTYESSVFEKGNTADRIRKQYREAVDKIFENPEFNYSSDISFGEIAFVSMAYIDAHDTPEYALITNELELDKDYDIKELGAKAGLLTVYVQDDEVTADKLAEILLKIKDIADKCDVTFYAIDCVLEYPKPEDGEQRNDYRVEVKDFLYTEIYDGDLTRRVTEADKEAKAYWQAEDEKIEKGEAK